MVACNRWIFGAFVISFAACSTGSETSAMCTLRGCQDGLSVALEATEWPSGNYAFDLSADGETLHCTATLPMPPCDVPALSCTGELEATVAASGCALPSGPQSFPEIRIPQGPASVELVVSRDGTRLGSNSFRPEYRVVQPNGPRCAPTCRQASERLLLSP